MDVAGDEVVGCQVELLVPGRCAVGQLYAFCSYAILFLLNFPIGNYLLLRFLCAAWGRGEGLEEKKI